MLSSNLSNVAISSGLEWNVKVTRKDLPETIDKIAATMYNDYSINESLFHWQSQSTTVADSPTGQRYIHHREQGGKVLLFVRELKSDRITGGAAAYTFLGTANTSLFRCLHGLFPILGQVMGQHC